MKTVFLEIEYLSKGKTANNTAILKVVPAENETPAYIKEISFKHPISFLTYGQLCGIYSQIETALEEIRATSETGLTIGENIPGALIKSEKGVGGFRNFVKSGIDKLKANGQLSESEVEQTNKAFELIDNFLGIKKDKKG